MRLLSLLAFLSRHAREQGPRTPRAVLPALFLLVSGCVAHGIESTSQSIGNDETYATLGYLWGGVRATIAARREPSTATFDLPLSGQLPCTRGGQGAVQGSLVGTKTGTTGSATLNATTTLTSCQFDANNTITEVTSPSVVVAGTIAIESDVWGTMNARLQTASITVNGRSCPGGIDVTLTGPSPTGQVTSTGTACGRTGAVVLP